MQKFSSNVVEKCLEKGGDIILSRFIDEIQYNNKISDLMKNNYGNYVVQKALKLSSDANKKRIIELIMKNIDKIGEKKLILKWRFIIQSYLQQNDHQGKMYNNNQAFPCDENINMSQSNTNTNNKGNINDYYFVQKNIWVLNYFIELNIIQ